MLRLHRFRGDTDLGPGWLSRPDPTRTRGVWVAELLDDLIFEAKAYTRVTVRYADGYPAAMEVMRFRDVTRNPDGSYRWHRPQLVGTDEPVEVTVAELDVVIFESPLSPVLESRVALYVAARLDAAASRFASASVPMGTLKQTGGEPLTDEEMAAEASAFEANRETNTIAFLNEHLDYQESETDPSRLQLVEARTYQDAALARVANVPNFSVGVGVPGDSMTYKTALTARYDLVDFAFGPYMACVTQTLSGPDVTPAGVEVRWILEDFVRSAALAGQTPPAPTVTPTTTEAATP
jgi:hypothetical protein